MSALYSDFQVSAVVELRVEESEKEIRNRRACISTDGIAAILELDNGSGLGLGGRGEAHSPLGTPLTGD